MKKIKELKIIYMGTPDFSASLLEWLIEEGFNVIGVVTKQDALLGRKKILTPTPVKEVAMKHNIPVFAPHRIRLDHNFIIENEPDLILTFAYGQIVPKAVLDAPLYGCLNFHGSILPVLRGASPIQMSLMHNDKETGVSLMEMVEAMDAGRVFGIEKFPLEDSDNFKTVSYKMVEASKTLILDHLEDIVTGLNVGVAQDESKVTFAPLLKPKDEEINLQTDNIYYILGKIRAFSPEIGVNVGYLDTTLKIFEAEFFNSLEDHHIGELFIENNYLLVQVIGGQISLRSIQKSGKNIVDAKSFINGERSKLPVILKSRNIND